MGLRHGLPAVRLHRRPRRPRVIWGPGTRYGAAYVQHSRLFVANPPENLPRDEAGRVLDPRARPEPCVWDGERLVPLGQPTGS